MLCTGRFSFNAELGDAADIFEGGLCELRPLAREDVTAAAPGRYSRERLSRHWIDVGRAYHYRADRDRALSSILEAERIAPHKTRINPAAREVVSHLLRSRRKNDLVELALRMGVA